MKEIVQHKKGKQWTKKQISDIFNFQNSNGLTDTEIKQKFNINSRMFLKWKKMRSDVETHDNNFLLQKSYTNVELAKDKFDIELLEKKKEVLKVIVERMLILIPKEEDLNKLSNALKAISEVEAHNKQLEVESNRTVFADFLEMQGKAFQTTTMILEKKTMKKSAL
jgi:hypothetical protein